MKRILTYLTIAILAVSFSSCRKLAEHGSFSGQWQVLSIDYPDGTVVDSPSHDLYYRFYRDVATVFNRKTHFGATGNILDYREKESFTLQFPYKAKLSQFATLGMTDPDATIDPENDEVEGYTVSFTIRKQDSQTLIMTTQYGVTLTCRKF